MGWNSTKDKLPPDMVDVLGYKDADKFKVVSIKNGVWKFSMIMTSALHMNMGIRMTMYLEQNI